VLERAEFDGGATPTPLQGLVMQTVLIVVHLIIVLALIGVVLLQRSEGGLGLGGGGSGGVSGFLTGRGQANALTRATAYLAVAFFITSLTLSWLATNSRAPRSVFDTAAPGAPTGQETPAQAPGQGPGILEQLQRMQGGGSPAPGTPAPETPPGAPQVPQSR
jgi:preprotein translocase subunit SecG